MMFVVILAALIMLLFVICYLCCKIKAIKRQKRDALAAEKFAFKKAGPSVSESDIESSGVDLGAGRGGTAIPHPDNTGMLV